MLMGLLFSLENTPSCDLEVLHKSAVLLRATIPVVLLFRSSYLLHIPIDIHPLCQVRKLSQHPLLQVRIDISLKTVLYHQFIRRMFDSVSSDLLSTSYIHTLIVYRSILLQILIILMRPCVSFLLIWQVLPPSISPPEIFISFLLVRSAEKTLVREKFQLPSIIVLFLMSSFLLLYFSIYFISWA